MSDHPTARFNFVLQLSEGLLVQLVEEMLQRGAIPSHFSESRSVRYDEYAIVGTMAYDLTLESLVPFLDTDTPEGFGVKIKISGTFLVKIEIENRPNDPGYVFELPVDAASNATVVGTLRFARVSDALYLEVRFVDVTEIDLALLDSTFPPRYREIVRQLVRRALTVVLRRDVARIPVTTAFASTTLAGWAIDDPVLRIIDDKSGNDHDDITVAINTWPNRGMGRPQRIHDWVANSRNFGAAVDQKLVLQFLDRAFLNGDIARRYNTHGRPDPRGEIRLIGLSFDLTEGAIRLSIGIGPTSGRAELWIHARVLIRYADQRFEVEVREVDVDLPWAIALAGFLIFNVLWLLVQGALKEFLDGWIEETVETTLEDLLNGGKIPLVYRGTIPGTTVAFEGAVANLAIAEDGISTVGNIRFT